MKVKRHDAAGIINECLIEPNNLTPTLTRALRCAVACLSGGRCANCGRRITERERGLVCGLDDSAVDRFGCCSEWRASNADHHD